MDFALQSPGITRSADFSEDRKYRWSLIIKWGPGDRLLNLLMLNPSKADEVENDPTVARQIIRAKQLGFDGLVVTNLFAFVATDPDVMKAAADPVGRFNNAHILEAATHCDMIICGWGKDGAHLNRARAVLDLLRDFDLYALKVSTSTGQPWHPLYVGYNQEPKLFRKKGR